MSSRTESMNPDIHLQRLLAAEVEEPLVSLVLHRTSKRPFVRQTSALEVTPSLSRRGHLELYRPNKKRAGLSSLAIHVGVIGLLVLRNESELSSRPLRKR